ncbi:hypothetical protein K466DRAFT_585343 [Polyporus arcularius HHB13444]|uniref:Uncharacterized protein n=2 Tax=Polyporaceae TaxID=5317 RepID=A0A5C3PRF4_9APHY|nr:hypothetical protein OH76DRAFT_1460455 [Polyporus brumalis]TFK88693.1 hypothetical protein K466DRAFT_585343 [Polyporus arcularius HHB13444]
MNFNSNDNLVLVAPRPVRLAAGSAPFPFHSPIAHRPKSRAAILSAATDAFDRLRLADDHADQQPAEPSEKDAISPRASPRSTPSEALEEFLSILHHPATIRFRPTSPLVMATNQATHFFTYRRQTPCSLSPSHPSEGLGLTLGDHADDKENEGLVYPFRILGSSLGSPVSRMQTRNPFHRHPSYEPGVAGYLRPPSAMSPSPTLALSPAAIPLPTPTPDEMELDAAS